MLKLEKKLSFNEYYQKLKEKIQILEEVSSFEKAQIEIKKLIRIEFREAINNE